MQEIVKDNKILSFYSEDQKNDLLYDIQKSSEAIVQWKAHINRVEAETEYSHSFTNNYNEQYSSEPGYSYEIAWCNNRR